MRVEPSAHTRPPELPFVVKELEHASITPRVKGISDIYVFVLYFTLNRNAYAKTVKKGDRALTVCTVETGIFDVATLENRCPVRTNKLIGAVLRHTCASGFLIGAVASQEMRYLLPICASVAVHPATKKN